MADFQSKIGEGLSKVQEGIDQGKNKLKTNQEVSRLNKQIHETSLKKGKVLIQLGLTAYQLIREGKINDEQLIEISQQLVGFDQVIYQTNKKIAELTEEKSNQHFCECGEPISLSDKFCGSCGKKVIIEEPKIVEKVKCPTCEEEMTEGTEYCGSCGTKLLV